MKDFREHLRGRGPLFAGLFVVLAGVALLLLTQAPWAQNLKSTKPVDESQSQSGKPPIAWAPDHLVVTLSPGETDTVMATATIKSAIPATVIQVVPELAPFVTVSPDSLPALGKGAEQTLQVAFAIPPDQPFGTLDGTLHLRAGTSTIARPFSIVLNTWPTVSVSLPQIRLQLNFPPTIQKFRDLTEVGGDPMLLDYTDSPGPESALLALSVESSTPSQSLAQWIETRAFSSGVLKEIHGVNHSFLMWAQTFGGSLDDSDWEYGSFVAFSTAIDGGYIVTLATPSREFAYSDEFMAILLSLSLEAP